MMGIEGAKNGQLKLNRSNCRFPQRILLSVQGLKNCIQDALFFMASVSQRISVKIPYDRNTI
jgi:hypothetical protein